MLKTDVEYINKSNDEFYVCLYGLSTWLKEVFQEISNLHVAHIHPCAPICEL